MLAGGYTVKDDVGRVAGMTLGAFHALCSASAATGLAKDDSPDAEDDDDELDDEDEEKEEKEDKEKAVREVLETGAARVGTDLDSLTTKKQASERSKTRIGERAR